MEWKKHWTYTECCIEMDEQIKMMADAYVLNLYRMLYWNHTSGGGFIRSATLNLYRMLYWNVMMNAAKMIATGIEPIQNVVLKLEA